jgi:MOSC domain-containing protein YiiM
MNLQKRTGVFGRVASLHLHPREPGDPLTSVTSFELVAGKGIAGNPRYFDHISRKTGKPSRRQVTLMACEQIAEHAAALGLETIAPGAVRANIETTGIDLGALIGQNIKIGKAILHFYEARTPCSKMDEICQGLRCEMEGSRQGVLAEVLQGGKVSVGDEILLASTAALHLSD